MCSGFSVGTLDYEDYKHCFHPFFSQLYTSNFFLLPSCMKGNLQHNHSLAGGQLHLDSDLRGNTLSVLCVCMQCLCLINCQKYIWMSHRYIQIISMNFFSWNLLHSSALINELLGCVNLFCCICVFSSGPTSPVCPICFRGTVTMYIPSKSLKRSCIKKSYHILTKAKWVLGALFLHEGNGGNDCSTSYTAVLMFARQRWYRAHRLRSQSPSRQPKLQMPSAGWWVPKPPTRLTNCL